MPAPCLKDRHSDTSEAESLASTGLRCVSASRVEVLICVLRKKTDTNQPTRQSKNRHEQPTRTITYCFYLLFCVLL